MRCTLRVIRRRKPACKEPKRPAGHFTDQQKAHREMAKLYESWREEKRIQAEIPKLLRSGREIGYRGDALIQFVKQKLQEERREAAYD